MKFEYRATDMEGNEVVGVEEAESAEALTAALHARRLQVSSVRVRAKRPLMRRAVSVEDMILFKRQLASLLETELPLPDSIRAIAKEAGKHEFKLLMEEVGTSVARGRSLADAMVERSDVFSAMDISMVRAGEETNTLPAMLERLADFSESRLRLRQRIQSAFVYPTIVCAMAFGVYLWFTFRMYSSFIEIYQELEISWYPAHNQVAVIAGFVFLSLALMACIVGSLATKIRWRVFDWILLRLPGLRRVRRSSSVSWIAGALSLGLERGMSLPAAIGMVEGTAEVSLVRSQAHTAREAAESGREVPEIMGAFAIFPNVTRWMISAAARRGTLIETLRSIATSHEEKASSAARWFGHFLDCLLVIVVGFVVATVGINILLLYLPLIRLMGAMG